MGRPKRCQKCNRFSHCNNNDLYCLSVARDILYKQQEENEYEWHIIEADENCVYECMACHRTVNKGICRKIPQHELVNSINDIHLYSYNQPQFEFLCEACALNYHIQVED